MRFFQKVWWRHNLVIFHFHYLQHYHRLIRSTLFWWLRYIGLVPPIIWLVYSVCMGSVSTLFSDKFTIMVNNLDLLESDHESQEDGQSLALGSTAASGRRSNNHLRSDLHMSGSSWRESLFLQTRSEGRARLPSMIFGWPLRFFQRGPYWKKVLSSSMT